MCCCNAAYAYVAYAYVVRQHMTLHAEIEFSIIKSKQHRKPAKFTGKKKSRMQNLIK